MKEELAAHYLSSRMREQGHAHRFALRLRHFVLKATEKITVKAWGDLFLMLGENCDARVSSENGVFDLSATNLSEQQHEHSGLILIENPTDSTVHVKMMQAIPYQENKNES